ncbi:MAG: preprotein translocase subunit SecE [Muribaculaceae bacterium]|nr:preprotein translocase subunit SecE [Muribaculaceae bacterium]
MKKILAYIQEAYNELVHKVSWPSQKDLVNNTLLVMVVFIISSLVIFAIDLVFKKIMEMLYGLVA